MTTKDQLRAIQSELQSHVENLRQLRKAATLADIEDEILNEYGETIKYGTWMIRNLDKIIGGEQEDENWSRTNLEWRAGKSPTTR